MNDFAEAYERVLSQLFKEQGYSRSAKGLYARTDDGVVWRGLNVLLRKRKAILSVQPSLNVYCPAAFEVVAAGLGQDHQKTVRNPSFRLGYPFCAWPLYDQMRMQYRSDRNPYSYDTDGLKFEHSAQLVVSDFEKVQALCFRNTSSVRALKDKIIAEPSGTGAGIYALALSYILNPSITEDEIEAVSRMYQSPLMEQFALYVRSRGTSHDANGTT